MTVTNQNQSASDTSDPETKLDWSTPTLEKLDFRNTEGGIGMFGEGTVGGFPTGSQAS